MENYLNTLSLQKKMQCKWQTAQYTETYRWPTTFSNSEGCFLRQVKVNSSLLQRNNSVFRCSLRRSKIQQNWVPDAHLKALLMVHIRQPKWKAEEWKVNSTWHLPQKLKFNVLEFVHLGMFRSLINIWAGCSIVWWHSEWKSTPFI